MALLGSVLGGLLGGGRRSYGSGGWNRGRTSYGRSPIGMGYGSRRRTSTGGLFGGTLGRMALGGLTAYGMRRFLGGNRRPYGY